MGTSLILSMIIFLDFPIEILHENYKKIEKNSIAQLFLFLKYLFFLCNGFVENISSRKFKNKSSLVQNTLVQST